MTGLYEFTSHTFTRCGASGQNGPMLSQMRTAYSDKAWAQTFLSENVSRPGIQLWTVPDTGIYTIQAVAPRGVRTTARGASMEGVFPLSRGAVVQVLVGQVGQEEFLSSGSGGTFVALSDNTPLIVAGGGGGGWHARSMLGDARSDTRGNDGEIALHATTSGSGGSDGTGGTAIDLGNSKCVGGGGGFYGDGTGGAGGGGASFVNGGKGGHAPVNVLRYRVGGFGGGGAAANAYEPLAAGGGGYSGGGASWGTTFDGSMGGGGGSYNAGYNQVNQGASNTGTDGHVTITRLKTFPTGTVSASMLKQFFSFDADTSLRFSQLYANGPLGIAEIGSPNVPTNGKLPMSAFYDAQRIFQFAYSDYLPVGTPVAIAAVSPWITVSALTMPSITVELNGLYISPDGQNIPAQVKTWDATVAGQVRFWAAFHSADKFTKAVCVVLLDNAPGISAYQSDACYWIGDLMNDAGWTPSGGIPAGAMDQIAGSGGYGVKYTRLRFFD